MEPAYGISIRRRPDKNGGCGSGHGIIAGHVLIFLLSFSRLADSVPAATRQQSAGAGKRGYCPQHKCAGIGAHCFHFLVGECREITVGNQAAARVTDRKDVAGPAVCGPAAAWEVKPPVTLLRGIPPSGYDGCSRLMYPVGFCPARRNSPCRNVFPASGQCRTGYTLIGSGLIRITAWKKIGTDWEGCRDRQI